VLAAGEPAVVLDSGRPAQLVLGDGVAAMADLRRAVWGDDARLALADTATQPGDLGTAAAADMGDFATSAQGEKADTAVQQTGSKGDGQNVKNLRRPTLVVDKVYPSASHDHDILWVDEATQTAYAVGQDRSFRKGRWPVGQNDGGIAFGAGLSRAPAGKLWASTGLFFHLPNGHLFMDQRDAGPGVITNTTLQRSTNDGVTWGTVLTLPVGVTFLGPTSVARDEVTGYLYAVEYAPGTTDIAKGTVDIWRSVDDGATWAVWVSFPQSVGSANPDAIRHWHSARYDSVSQRVYFTAGDGHGKTGIHRVNAAGTDVEPVILDAQVSKPAGQTTIARAVDLMFFPNYIAWPCDGSGGDNYIARMHRDQIGQASPAYEQVAVINSAGWWTQKAAADGSAWIACGSNEAQPGDSRTDTAVHLYAVTDDGAQVDEVAAFEMPVALGSSSLSGLGLGSGGGDAFWLRGFNHNIWPHVNYSGRQIRARLAWGAVPVTFPTPARRLYGEVCFNHRAVLAASAYETFGVTRAPQEARVLAIRDWGIKVLSGSEAAAKLQIWNVTQGAQIAQWTWGTNWRRHLDQDTTEAHSYWTLNAGDEVEFRLLETTGTEPITVTGYVKIAWTFYQGL